MIKHFSLLGLHIDSAGPGRAFSACNSDRKRGYETLVITSSLLAQENLGPPALFHITLPRFPTASIPLCQATAVQPVSAARPNLGG